METMPPRFRERFLRTRIARKFAIGQGFVNPSEILINDPACAKIEMAYLRVPHLPVGQSDIAAAGAEFSTWVIAVKAVVKRRARQQGGVAILFALLPSARIDSPAVADNENDGLRHAVSFATLGVADKCFPGC